MDAVGFEPGEWHLWRSFLAVHARLSRAVEEQLQRDFQFSQGEYGTLAALVESAEGGLRIGQLADALGWEQSRVSHLVARMERTDLVRREPTGDDGRGRRVVATPEGRRRLLGSVRGHAAEVRRIFLDKLGPEDRRQMQELLDRLIDRESAARSDGDEPHRVAARRG